MSAVTAMLVRIATSQQIPVHISRINGPRRCPMRIMERFSIRPPNATRIVAIVNGINAVMTREQATRRSFTSPQMFGRQYAFRKPSIHEMITPEAVQTVSRDVDTRKVTGGLLLFLRY